jgi:lysozyme family protein
MSVPNFDRAYAFVRRMEGGDHRPSPSDPNPTSRGITQKTYDAYCTARNLPPKSVFSLDEGDVAGFYRDYWADSRAPQLPSDNLALCHFDAAFNMGHGQAAKLLQRAAGALADGILGNKTLDQVRLAMVQDGERALLVKMCGLRLRRYRQIVDDNPAMAPNLPGWTARVTALQKEVGIG